MSLMIIPSERLPSFQTAIGCNLFAAAFKIASRLIGATAEQRALAKHGGILLPANA